MQRRALGLLTAFAFAGCVTSDGEILGVGTAVANIDSVPAGVGCIEIQISSGNRTTTRTFDVVAGQSSVLKMNGLPTGSDVFVGSAYNSSCASVLSTSVPSWLSDPTTVNVLPGTTANVQLALKKNAAANVDVQFVDDGGTNPSPSPSTNPSPSPSTNPSPSPSTNPSPSPSTNPSPSPSTNPSPGPSPSP
jgi:hypothetical protein